MRADVCIEKAIDTSRKERVRTSVGIKKENGASKEEAGVIRVV